MRTLQAIMILSLSNVLLTSLAGPAAAERDWVHYGGNEWNERHSDLGQITKENVAHLVPRRVLQLGEPTRGLVGSPVVVDGILYMSASNGWLHAFNLKTGMKIWSHEHKGSYSSGSLATLLAGGTAAPACCANQSRGVAFANGTLFMAFLAHRAHAESRISRY